MEIIPPHEKKELIYCGVAHERCYRGKRRRPTFLRMEERIKGAQNKTLPAPSGPSAAAETDHFHGLL